MRPRERGNAMSALARLETTPLTWQRAPGIRPSFTLHAKEGIVATLAFQPGDNTLARVDTADGAWTLKHRGFPADTVTLREVSSHLDLATFHPHPLGHGRLVFLSGDAFDWVRLEGPEAGGAFLDPDGMTLVLLTLRPDTSHKMIPDAPILAQAEVGLPHRIQPAGPALLAAVAWYLLRVEALLEHPVRAAETCLRM